MTNYDKLHQPNEMSAVHTESILSQLPWPHLKPFAADGVAMEGKHKKLHNIEHYSNLQ
jgi:hypothetical protein